MTRCRWAHTYEQSSSGTADAGELSRSGDLLGDETFRAVGEVVEGIHLCTHSPR